MIVFGRLRSSGRGISTVVGTLFFLILALAAIGVMFTSTHGLIRYFHTQHGMSQFDVDRANENIEIQSVTFDENAIIFTFVNKGGLTSHLIQLWIIDSTEHRVFTPPSFDVYLTPGEKKTHRFNFDWSLSEGYTFKIVSEMGNTASYSARVLSTNYHPMVTVTLGTISSGDQTNLQADDESYLVIDSSLNRSDWFGSAAILEPRNSVVSFKVTYDGSYSTQGVNQTIYLYNYTSNSWDQISRQIVGTSDVTVTLSLWGEQDYIFGNGEMRMRVVSSLEQPFQCKGDLMRWTILYVK